MNFHAFEDYGIYGRGSSAEQSVPKQRTAANATDAALAYMRRHG